jgi:hypothetical protein
MDTGFAADGCFGKIAMRRGIRAPKRARDGRFLTITAKNSLTLLRNITNHSTYSE